MPDLRGVKHAHAAGLPEQLPFTFVLTAVLDLEAVMRYRLLTTESGAALASLVSLTPLGTEPGGVFCTVHLQLQELYSIDASDASTNCIDLGMVAKQPLMDAPECSTH
ncbi:MAG: hypothetical protein E4H02_12915 [Lentisphaerales bacterium]|nr:MAG: hypothetical protein E4H02_12915 [Lentisphaerales bacterium]